MAGNTSPQLQYAVVTLLKGPRVTVRTYGPFHTLADAKTYASELRAQAKSQGYAGALSVVCKQLLRHN